MVVVDTMPYHDWVNLLLVQMQQKLRHRFLWNFFCLKYWSGDYLHPHWEWRSEWGQRAASHLPVMMNMWWPDTLWVKLTRLWPLLLVMFIWFCCNWQNSYLQISLVEFSLQSCIYCAVQGHWRCACVPLFFTLVLALVSPLFLFFNILIWRSLQTLLLGHFSILFRLN